MFSGLARRYQLFNRLSSLGLDKSWRSELVKRLFSARRVLDVGTGTGDLARDILVCHPEVNVVGVDLSFGMLVESGRCQGPSFPRIQAGVDRLPFKDGSFDWVVSAFVLRNLVMGGVLTGGLLELSRVLEPGGRLMFLDLTRPSRFILRWGHEIYGRTILPMIGRVLFGNKWPGSYLQRSINALPDTEVLRTCLLSNGFSKFECRPLWGGIVSLFTGVK
jgi:demethylmenaquinone methyltransferase/2-methoxy-6-polyprenyl-1,4-benzoquinol methylase